jgi:hypothetical protein
MSILSSIFGKIFHNTPAATTTAANAPATPVPAPTSTPAAATAPATPPVAAAAQVAPMKEVDVEQLLDGMAAKSSEKLNWKTSIVDLMKLLQLDSSITARKELAQELHYSGDTSDSASMNIWLHKQVMQKLADNGGKVPDSLK